VVVWWIAPRPRISVLVTRAGLGARSFGWSTLVVDMLAPRGRETVEASRSCTESAQSSLIHHRNGDGRLHPRLAWTRP
jgi:hypothetical protein